MWSCIFTEGALDTKCFPCPVVPALCDLLSLGIDADRKRSRWKIRLWWLRPSSSTQVFMRSEPYATGKYNCQCSSHSLRFYWSIIHLSRSDAVNYGLKNRESEKADTVICRVELIVLTFFLEAPVGCGLESCLFSKLEFCGHSNHDALKGFMHGSYKGSSDGGLGWSLVSSHIFYLPEVSNGCLNLGICLL
jgi:hypothetical protein